jgi:hypothetical protein
MRHQDDVVTSSVRPVGVAVIPPADLAAMRAQWMVTVVTAEGAQTTEAPGFWQATIDSVWPAFTPALDGSCSR